MSDGGSRLWHTVRALGMVATSSCVIMLGAALPALAGAPTSCGDSGGTNLTFTAGATSTATQSEVITIQCNFAANGTNQTAHAVIYLSSGPGNPIQRTGGTEIVYIRIFTTAALTTQSDSTHTITVTCTTGAVSTSLCTVPYTFYIVPPGGAGHPVGSYTSNFNSVVVSIGT